MRPWCALEEDIHNIEHYDVEIYNTIGKLMDELLESEASINIFCLMRWMMLSDDEINPAITSSSKLPYIDMEEEDDVDFTSENEPEPRCNDSNK